MPPFSTLALAAGLAAPVPLPPVPTAEQLAWQRMELTMFVHFGVNTFGDREWGDGHEDPASFNPTALDATQWVRTAQEAGFKLIILTAKHHDGFCLWPSQYTAHAVKRSPWRGGQGDVVREFTAACHAAGIKVGLYLSPWDRNSAVYGTEAYNDYFVNQLTELLTQYGTVDEVWFDGACGEGPNGKRQVYDWERYYATIRRLAPRALIAIMGPDVRWVGNESGVARPGEASARGDQWSPAECDVSIRPGWFYHAAQDGQVKSLDHLLDIYFKSVGRNSVLLLNVPPDRRGLFADPDVERLREFGAAVRAIRERSVLAGATISGPAPGTAALLDGDLDTFWAAPDGSTSATLELDLGAPREFNVVGLSEAIAYGERVQRYAVEVQRDGQWELLARGTVIGSRNLHAVPRQRAQRLRWRIEAAKAAPVLAGLELADAPQTPPATKVSLTYNKPASASNVHPGGTVWGADKAVDGDLDTRWATSDETRECWLDIDLEQPETFGTLTIAELDPRITSFRLLYRLTADQPWQTAYQGSRAGKAYEQQFAPVTGRYLRLHILEATKAPTIWEVGVF
ncbi:MAG: alpha-L-fucosidase [Fimbriimonadaceae bacterium]|nr:alpha-L-fucosidase [Fimbriimonadaceae bacterium]